MSKSLFVWIHTNSPPQHIAHVLESEVNTAAKLKTWVDNKAQTRGIAAYYAGVFEGDNGELTLNMFDSRERAERYVTRNDVPIISTID